MSYETLDYAFRDIDYLLTAAMVIIMIGMFAVLASKDISSALFGDDEKRCNVSRFKTLIGGIALIAVILLVENGFDLLSGHILFDYRAEQAAMQEQKKIEYRLAGLTGALPPVKALQAIGVDDTGANNIVDALKSVGFEPDGLARVETDGHAINLLAVKHYKDDLYDDVTLSLVLENNTVKSVTCKNKPLMTNGKVVSNVSNWTASISDYWQGVAIADKELKARMWSPDSAELAMDTVNVNKVNGVLIVTGVVKGVNAFGVPVRSPFVVRLVLSGKTYTIKNISFG